MSRSLSYRIIIAFVVPVLVAGCVTPSVYDYTALENSRPRSILVIPPVNNSIEVNAPYIYLASVTRPLAEKGYYVFPVAVIDSFLKENGLPTPAEMNSIPLDKIEEVFGADAVLYASIEEWGQKFQLLTSVTTVQANLRLVDTRTGVLLWETVVRGVEASDDADAGLMGAIINAIVTQVARSVSDATYRVSSNANYIAIHNQSNGLLHGPYFNPDGIREWSLSKNGAASNEKFDLGDELELLHVGKATSEIIQQTYDQELWSRSLELAEGDEEKRKGIYVKLRAKQLADEDAQAEELVMPAGESAQNPELLIDVSGSYISGISASGNAPETKSFLKEIDRREIILEQSGNTITGTDRLKTFEINGTREGSTITFYIPRGNEIEGSWEINADATSLEGNWHTDGHGGASGKWDLTRVGPPAKTIEIIPDSNSALGQRALPVSDLSGIYLSEITSNSKWQFKKKYQRLRINLNQNGTSISGIDSQYGTKIGGSISGTTVNFFVEPGEAAGGYDIDGQWQIAPDRSTLEGSWKCRGCADDAAGEWNLIKIK